MCTIGRAATILALCLSLGFHWLALQSIAWTTMLVENVRHTPVYEAVARTFDGGHPCNLCHAVAEGKKSEKKSDLLPMVAKIDLICSADPSNLEPPWNSIEYSRTNSATVRRAHAPPLPPPRSLPG
jgi:hypothetical protein